MNKRKIARISAIAVTAILLLVLLASCTSNKQTTTATTVTATAKKGNLVVDITAVGNLAYSQTEELSFDTNGTVSEVIVDVGDSVTEGQVLARLDMTEWQQNITDLESMLASKQQSLTNANRTVTAKEDAVAVAEQGVDDAEYNVIKQERAVARTQISIETAELNLKKLEQDFYFGTGDQWISINLDLTRRNLELTRAELDDANRTLEEAKDAVITAERDVENAKLDVLDAQTGVTKAEQDVVNAQKALDDANATHPELTSPFDGLITAINTKAGSEIYKGGAIVTIVDPNNFKAEVLVGETDISDVKVGGDATVELDAITGVSLSAKVTSISPTATTSQGVVSYSVTVEIVSQQVTQQTSTQSNSANQFTLPEGFTPGELPEGAVLPEPGQTTTQSTTTSESVQLREGLTASVSIIIQQRTNVVYVPNQAIKTVNGTATVNVIKDGVTTERSITTGISTSKYTEVTEGLSEGEEVVYTRSTSSSSTGQNMGGGGFIMGR